MQQSDLFITDEKTIHLYVKQHSLTKLKYFGKYTGKDLEKYPGSGTRWTRHIKKHGKEHVHTIECWTFNNQSEATNFALEFSQKNDIVNSEEWANLIPEDAVRGWSKGSTHSEETRRKLSKPRGKFTVERSKQQSENQKGSKRPEETKGRMSIAQIKRYSKTPARSGKRLYDKDGVSKWFYEIPIDPGWILRQRRSDASSIYVIITHLRMFVNKFMLRS